MATRVSDSVDCLCFVPLHLRENPSLCAATESLTDVDESKTVADDAPAVVEKAEAISATDRY
jgi:hypothetical protein